RFAFCIQQNVSGFDVAMKNAVFMRVMHSARYVRDELGRLAGRHRRALDYFVELAAFDEFHAELARAVAFAYLVDRNDTGMLQASCRFSFKAKAFQGRFARPLTKANDL